METDRPREELYARVYGRTRYDCLPHRPLQDIVKVDLAITGCPMEKSEFLHAVSCLLNGDPPALPDYPVCQQCKIRETDCLLLSHGIPCAGPVTVAGCNARCPGFNVPCIGCRGPVDEANIASMREILARKGIDEQDIRRRLRTFAAQAVREIEP